MAFLSEYKKLDNLCKDMLNGEKGISVYIECMEQCNHRAERIAGWKNDYKRLKNYRYIRNRIVHDNDVEESDVCTISDEEWVRGFYERILKQEDPLALYEKNIRKSGEVKGKQADNNIEIQNETECVEGKKAIVIQSVISMLLGLLMVLGLFWYFGL